MRPFLVFFILIYSCIPIRLAPTIESYRIVKAKRFKRDLPRSYGFVFEDPKDADEFYNFINMKFDLGHIDVEFNVPFTIDTNTYYLSFYERERVTKTFNLLPVLVDAKIESNGYDPILETLHTSRNGYWYLILIVLDSEMNDGLSPDYGNRDAILHYLRNLQEEYLTTQNYLESYFLRK